MLVSFFFFFFKRNIIYCNFLCDTNIPSHFVPEEFAFVFKNNSHLWQCAAEALVFVLIKSAAEALEIWVVATGLFRPFFAQLTVQFWKSPEFVGTWSSPELVKGKTFVWSIPGLQVMEVCQSTWAISLHAYSLSSTHLLLATVRGRTLFQMVI